MASTITKFTPLQLPLEDVLKATNNFAEKNIIGKGGFGKVYKGQLLRSGKLVKFAARRLDGNHRQGYIEFWTEISVLSNLKHDNLVSIIGFCDENNEKIIINNHYPKGSLLMYLSNLTLTWIQRLRICVGAARALSYLHNEDGRNYSVIHRNINSSTILLDDKFEAKLSGFEYSIKHSIYRMNQVLLSEAIVIEGYMDPAIAKTGGVTHKSDIYSFGIVLWEILCGRKAFIPNNDNQYLAPLAKIHYESKTLQDIIHPDLWNQMDSQSLINFSKAAYSCIKEERAQRPSMGQIVNELENALETQFRHENDEASRYAVGSKSFNYLKEKKLEHLKIQLSDIVLATDNFSDIYFTDSTGFCSLYRAELEHFDSENHSSMDRNNEGELPKRRNNVVIKRILPSADGQGEQYFYTEIEVLTSCKHRNIGTLLGFCDEGLEMILVLENVSNGYLVEYMTGTNNMALFSWANRLRICLDIAHGLNYLHSDKDNKKRIIHRDMKSQNIVLDEERRAKIVDFGLCVFLPADQEYLHLNQIAGTESYLDPEYVSTGKLGKGTDVYSFGVVLLEIVCGRLAYDKLYMENKESGLAAVARKRYHEGKVKEMIDPIIEEENSENNLILNTGPNKDSLNKYLKIAYECVAETQDLRPTMEVVIKELEEALSFQENHKDKLRISLEDITLATQNFNHKLCIGIGGFGKVYTGKLPNGDGCTIVAKRMDKSHGQGEQQFFNELQILSEYKHENIISLVGYCNEKHERIIVYELASKGGLDKYLKHATLTWIRRLKICTDVASALAFLHGGVETQETLIHRDIKASNILLNSVWKAKLGDFGLSLRSTINKGTDYTIDYACGTKGYVDPVYLKSGLLTIESDIYSFGVVLFEILCGKAMHAIPELKSQSLLSFVKYTLEEGKQYEFVFEAIKKEVVLKSLTTFINIIHRCLDDDREKRPTAKEVLAQLKEALAFQVDDDIWEPKLPRDYKEIFRMSKTPEIYSTEKKKDLYEMLSKGILLQKGKMWFSLRNDGKRNEMISAKRFSFIDPKLHKWKSLRMSRFHTVAKMFDISNLNIQIKIKTQFLSPGVTYGVHLVFKFEDLRKRINKPTYVNLRYKKGSETLHAYFATWRDDGWMMIELDRFLNHQENIDFEVLLESFSRCYCESDAIYVEGIEFRAIDSAKQEEIEELKEAERVLNTNSIMDHMQQLRTKNEEAYKRSETDIEGEKSLLESEVSGKICHMLPAREVLYDPLNVKLYNSKPSEHSRYREVIEFLPKQVFRIKCKIESQMLSPDTDYMCYLVFKPSEKCRGLHCPVKVKGLHKNTKEAEILYFRSPDTWNLHCNNQVPKQREDGWMEVIIWKFNSNHDLKNGCIPLNLKLVSYQGTMSGLIVEGLEFRPM